MVLKTSTCLSLIALIGVVTTGAERRTIHRSKRYLVYPDGGPARAQFIIGLGIPVDLEEQSVTVGTVIKFQYDLPTNSTEYTSRIYGFANTITSRDMNKAEVDNSKEKVVQKETEHDDLTEIDDDIDEENNTLVDLVFDNDHPIRKRAAYMEGGTELQVDENRLSLEEAIERQEKLDKEYQAQQPETRRTNRWDLYKIMEKMVERYGYTGRPCMLRTVCEAAEIPFTHKNGLLGEITHILFTPSTTRDDLSHHTDNEYHAAERLGRQLGVDCESLFPECEASLLDTFTQVGLETLHKPLTTRDDLSHNTDNEYHAAKRLGTQLGVACESLFSECEASLLDTFTQVELDKLQMFG